jgi:hypothetical protein
MSWCRRLLILLALVSVAALAGMGEPDPPRARANVACDVGSAVAGGVGPVAGAIGLGNPAGGICDAVTSKVAGAVTKPITDAVKGLGNSIFEEVTTWTAEGATWLIGKVVAGIEKTTTPDLTSRGFLAEYAKMAQIAVLLGAAMLLLAILEAAAQSSWEVLAKAVLVNVPLAFIGTSAAFTIVQLLLLATDQMSHAVAVATHHHSEHFFKSAIAGLGEAGGTAGREVNAGSPVSESTGEAAGAVAVPLFVTFLAAIIGAFAAFFVWIEMLMRDAAVYVVALFMPISMATFISPRWSGILRRTVELLVVVIGSKFVSVSIIALAAGLVSEEGAPVEHILAASALLLLACFSPFVLMRMVLSTESAMSAAYSRRSASGGGHAGLQLGREAAMFRNIARSNRGGSAEPPEVWSVKGGGGGGQGGGRSVPKPGGQGGGGGASAGGGSATAGQGAGAAAGGAGIVAPAPGAVVQGAQAGAQHLGDSAPARSANGPESSSSSSSRSRSPGVGKQTDGAAPVKDTSGEPPSASPSPTPPPPSERVPRPPRDLDVKPTGGGEAR